VIDSVLLLQHKYLLGFELQNRKSLTIKELCCLVVGEKYSFAIDFLLPMDMLGVIDFETPLLTHNKI
jgi:hypothetical protein